MTAVSVDLKQTNCWCGITFMIPGALLTQAHDHAHTIYCPHGHAMTWKETEADRLRRERDRLKQQEARLEEEKRQANIRAYEAEERAKKSERETKRLRKRATAGTCPCCNRTFANMAEHMKHQHPQFVADEGAKIVPIKRRAS
jgi:hypothetical protein